MKESAVSLYIWGDLEAAKNGSVGITGTYGRPKIFSLFSERPAGADLSLATTPRRHEEEAFKRANDVGKGANQPGKRADGTCKGAYGSSKRAYALGKRACEAGKRANGPGKQKDGWVACRFADPSRASKEVNCSKHSGKWNHCPREFTSTEDAKGMGEYVVNLLKSLDGSEVGWESDSPAGLYLRVGVLLDGFRAVSRVW